MHLVRDSPDPNITNESPLVYVSLAHFRCIFDFHVCPHSVSCRQCCGDSVFHRDQSAFVNCVCAEKGFHAQLLIDGFPLQLHFHRTLIVSAVSCAGCNIAKCEYPKEHNDETMVEIGYF